MPFTKKGQKSYGGKKVVNVPAMKKKAPMATAPSRKGVKGMGAAKKKVSKKTKHGKV